MKSFRHEHEDLLHPIVEKDILDLAQKIELYRKGKMDEEKFRSLRLARGVYGQRQQGVQMIRIKIPYGKMTAKQLIRIAQVSDEYSNGNLHTTTRQDIQIHHVSLDRTPELWSELERDDITLREACGNTVRNITASYLSGIDPEEVFDVSPYAHTLFEYFLRNPICQELGRKFKIAFSSSEKDTAFTFMHDLGFIPKIKDQKKGFKVVVGGGLGAQPFLAQTAFEFLEEELIIPFTESLIRVYDRYGERTRRHKARIKYLLDEIGLEKLLELTESEKKALPYSTFPIIVQQKSKSDAPKYRIAPLVDELSIDAYDLWLKTNVFEQKQKGYFAIKIKLTKGDISSKQARSLAQLVNLYAADDIRVSPDQGLLLKYVVAENLPYLFTQLNHLKLAESGAASIADITTCPGTDTCNLGITSSYGAARVLEQVIREDFPFLIGNEQIRIKISGCMNSCGQHTIATIGFHGSTIKHLNKTMPALQVLLGGGPLGNGHGRIADKVIKVPAKRGPEVLKTILNDFLSNKISDESFYEYYDRKGKIFFYELLKPFTDVENITEQDFIDWGHENTYTQAIGVGECAGVTIDLIQTLLFETEEKLNQAQLAYNENRFSDSIYFSYSTLISAAKTLLIDRGEKTNSQDGIVRDFDQLFRDSIYLNGSLSFAELVFQIKENNPEKNFAKSYLQQAQLFLNQIIINRKKENSYVK